MGIVMPNRFVEDTTGRIREGMALARTPGSFAYQDSPETPKSERRHMANLFSTLGLGRCEEVHGATDLRNPTGRAAKTVGEI
eukprot:1581235-Amphidinium_carterae.2